jgi:flagellar protein FliJ
MFEFSLETVLDVRRREEETAQRELAKAIDALSQIGRRIGELQESRSASMRERRALAESGFDPARLALHVAYTDALIERIEEARKEAVAAQALVDARRAALLETTRRCEILEELKKVEFQEYQRLEMVDERKRNDDIAIFAFGRNRMEKNSAPRKAKGNE